MDIGATLWQGLKGSLPIILLFVGALVVLGLLKGSMRKGIRAGSPIRERFFEYKRRSTLFTSTEAKFLETLRQAVPTLEVFGKVRLEDVVEARSGLSFGETTSMRNYIKSRHLDYTRRPITSLLESTAIGRHQGRGT